MCIRDRSVPIRFKRSTVTGTVAPRHTGALDGTVTLKVSCVHRVQLEPAARRTVVWEARGKLGHVLLVHPRGSMVFTLWEMLR